MNVWTELAALCVYGPLVVLLHEAGHALFARAGGYRVTSFAVGLGPPLWSIYLRDGVVLHVDRWLVAGGACTAIPMGTPTRRRAWFHAGGLIVQAGLALLLLMLPSSALVDRMAQFNVLVALTNALPWRWAGQASDGWHLLDALTGTHRAGTVVAQRGSLQRMAEREEAAGSPVGSTWCQVCLAWSDVQLGAPDQARARLAGHAAQATRAPWLDALFHVVDAEIHRTEARPLRALAILEEATGIDGLSDDGHALVRLAEARAWLDAGGPERSRSSLAELAGTAGPLATQATAVLLWASLDGPTVDLELATWRVERRAHEAWIDPLDAVVALAAAADELRQRGRLPAARGASDAAAAILSRVLRSLDEVDARQARMRVGQSSWHSHEARGHTPMRSKERRSTDRI